MKLIKTIDAAGQVLCHDITRIVRGETKGPAFRKGHIITEADIPALLDMGKEHVYIWELAPGQLHENDAAEILCGICRGAHISRSEVKEGKIDLTAETDGLFTLDKDKLNRINSLGQIAIAARHDNFPVKAGDALAGMRVVPLVIRGERLNAAREIGGGVPLMGVLPYKVKKAGVVTTGSEVLNGRIADAFTPVIEEKLAEYGTGVLMRSLPGDDPARITAACMEMIGAGMDIVICTGGMSVDPDDRTPLAIKNTGARVVSYGAPVLPGSMFMLAYYAAPQGDVPILGLPGCVMYSKRTIFDLVLPRILAGVKISAENISGMGAGGLCLNCGECAFPNCGFGK
ncbi:MAG: molybdopterin-binding protein [Clostridiales bacterium]|jgi:molybdopterin biosynthesis enzyme|nr:molybdopterin-binding protein [Clostridiales bacterium]